MEEEKHWQNCQHNLLMHNYAFASVTGEMMNVGWLKPFEHSTYSVGVIYLVVQNVPRPICFKLENILIS